MKRRYDFRINTPKPSREDIEKHRDFDALLEKYRQAPAPRRSSAPVRRLVIASLTLAAALTGWFLITGVPQASSYEEKALAYFASQPYINPPFNGDIQKEFSQLSVDASSGGTLEGKNGTRLHIPNDAFQDENGTAVEGEVEIRYREMHDFVDYFLTGIPMTYDSAGLSFQLESSGMMEIYAEQNGKRLQVRPGRAIQVDLVSEVFLANTEEINGFHTYRLDTTQRNWVYQGANRMTILETIFPELPEDHPLCGVQESFQMELAALESAERLALSDLENEVPLPTQPLRPQRHNGTDFVFDFDLTALLQNPQAHSLSPEQVELLREGTLWQLHPAETTNRAALAQQWDDIQLAPVNNRDFRLTLFRGNQQLSIMVNPVLSGADYDRAMEQYQTALAAYEQSYAHRNEMLQLRRDSIRTHFAAIRDQLDTRYDEAWAAADAPHPPIRHKVINHFEATQLGIWNCDRPVEAKFADTRARFQDEEGDALRHRIGYLVDQSANTLIRFYTDRIAKLPLDPDSGQLIWMVTDDKQLAVLRPARARQLKSGEEAGDQTIVLDIIDHPLRDEQDVREALYSSL